MSGFSRKWSYFPPKKIRCFFPVKVSLSPPRKAFNGANSKPRSSVKAICLWWYFWEALKLPERCGTKNNWKNSAVKVDHHFGLFCRAEVLFDCRVFLGKDANLHQRLRGYTMVYNLPSNKKWFSNYPTKKGGKKTWWTFENPPKILTFHWNPDGWFLEFPIKMGRLVTPLKQHYISR